PCAVGSAASRLDPHPPAVQPDVLVDEREPEPDAAVAGALAALAAAGEAVEDDVALGVGDAWTVVLDADLHGVARAVEDDAGRATGVLLRVVDEVGEHPRDAPLVDANHHVVDLLVVHHRDATTADDADRLDDHLGDEDVFEVQLDRPRV